MGFRQCQTRTHTIARTAICSHCFLQVEQSNFRLECFYDRIYESIFKQMDNPQRETNEERFSKLIGGGRIRTRDLGI